MAGGEQQVTRLAFQARDQSRVDVYVDGRRAFVLSAVQAVQLGLKPGRWLTPAELAELAGLSDLERARGQAVALLTLRPRSRRELADRLGQKGHAAAVVEQVLVELEEKGHLDDAAFARYWVENRRTHRPRGARALAAELRTKGVEPTVVAEAVATSDDDEAAAALALARRRAASLAGLDAPRFRQRLGAFLERKGFRYETARAVVSALLRERDNPEVADIGGDDDLG